MSFTADTQDQTAQTLQTRAQQFLAGIENRTLFFRLWWKELDEVNAKRLMDASGDYRYYLEALRLFKPHTLTEAEEKIVNTKNVTGSTALINLFDCDHQPLHLQDARGRQDKGNDRGRVVFLPLQHRPEDARQELSGTVPCLWQ